MLSASLPPFVVAVLASVRRVAWYRGVVSSPRADRWHPKPTPLRGGVALWLATLGTAFFILPIAAAATGMCALGLLDEAPRAGSERHPVASGRAEVRRQRPADERATYFGRRFGLDEESSLFTQHLSSTLLALPTREP